MSNDALILDLAADLTPVKPRSILREALLLLALCAAELALLLGLGAMRSDMGTVFASPYMLWKLGSLMVLAGLSSTVAVRSFSPTASPRRGLVLALFVGGLAMVGGALVQPAGGEGRALLERLAPAHGMLCAVSIIVLALPMMAALSLLMRSGAPTHPEGSALASGLAAATCGALIFAFCCPMNDPLYVIVWYFAACAVVAATARWFLPRYFRL
jgi:hypothetical protein